jgi:hypothetical protein
MAPRLPARAFPALRYDDRATSRTEDVMAKGNNARKKETKKPKKDAAKK